jgi:hypothetical protein
MDFKIMKKIVFGLLITMGMLNAQNNLVFNKALNFRLVPGNDGINLGQTATVPEGKVWKIESYQRDGAGGINVGFEIQDPEYGSAISYGSYSSTPIWLQEGTILKAPSDGIFFSVLEFNVVPTSTGTGSGTGGGGVSSDGLVFEEAMSITLTRTQVLNSDARLFGEITVPEGKTLKIFNVSTFLLLSSGDTQNEGACFIYIGDELFFPSSSGNNTSIRFIPSGTHTVKLDGGNNVPNRIVVNAILYSIP